jgi:hypothetical protein
VSVGKGCGSAGCCWPMELGGHKNRPSATVIRTRLPLGRKTCGPLLPIGIFRQEVQSFHRQSAGPVHARDAVFRQLGGIYEIAATPTFTSVIRTHQPTTAIAVEASFVRATIAHPMVSRTRTQMVKMSNEVPNAISHWGRSVGR